MIAHEIAEGKAGTRGAEQLAADTDLPVSEGTLAHTPGHGRKEPMIHNITAGPVDMELARRLLEEMGDGATLGGWKVRFEVDCVVIPWKGGTTNRVAEEYAIRLQRGPDAACRPRARASDRCQSANGLAKTNSPTLIDQR